MRHTTQEDWELDSRLAVGVGHALSVRVRESISREEERVAHAEEGGDADEGDCP